MLDSLVESLPTAHILLLVNYRPEYQHRWGSKTSYTQLWLDPLPPASADELLQALLGDDLSFAPLTRLLEVEGPYYLALLAEACGKGGQTEEGLRVLAEALTASEQDAWRLW